MYAHPYVFAATEKKTRRNTLNSINCDINKVILEESKIQLIYRGIQLGNKINVRDKAEKGHYSTFKVKFRQASNRYKRVLEAAKFAFTNKTKDSITSLKLGCHDFWQIANNFLNEDKSAILPLFHGPEVLSSA